MVGVGIAQYQLHKKTSREQQRLQERLTAIEEQKRSVELASRSAALVVCEKRKEPTSRGVTTWIVFRNDGQARAPARAVDLWFEREPLSSLLTGDEEAHYPRLMPGQEWKVRADPTMGLPDRITFRYGWTDAGGAAGDPRSSVDSRCVASAEARPSLASGAHTAGDLGNRSPRGASIELCRPFPKKSLMEPSSAS